MSDYDRLKSLQYFFGGPGDAASRLRDRGLDQLGTAMRYDQARGYPFMQGQLGQLQRIAADPIGGGAVPPAPPTAPPGAVASTVGAPPTAPPGAVASTVGALAPAPPGGVASAPAPADMFARLQAIAAGNPGLAPRLQLMQGSGSPGLWGAR